MTTKLWIVKQVYLDYHDKEYTNFSLCESEEEMKDEISDIRRDGFVSLELRSIDWEKCDVERLP